SNRVSPQHNQVFRLRLCGSSRLGAKSYFHSATKILNSYLSLALRSEAKTTCLPSGENSGNEVKPPNEVTCSRFLPSRSTRNSSNWRPSQLLLLDAKRMRRPSGAKVGAKLAQPKSVICRAFLPSASAT